MVETRHAQYMAPSLQVPPPPTSIILYRKAIDFFKKDVSLFEDFVSKQSNLSPAEPTYGSQQSPMPP